MNNIDASLMLQIVGLKKIGSENGVNIVHNTAKDRISINGFGEPAKVILEYIQQELESFSNVIQFSYILLFKIMTDNKYMHSKLNK